MSAMIALSFLTLMWFPANVQANAGQGWDTSPTSLESNAGDALNPQVAMNDFGKIVVVWEQYDGTTDSIYARYCSAGTWGSVVKIETGSGHAGSQQVAMDRNGNAIAIWQQYVGKQGNIYVNHCTNGVWGTAKLLETITGEARYPQVAMDSSGRAVAIWSQYDSGMHLSIYTARYSSGAWSSPVLMESATGDAINPHIAISDGGTAVAVWEQKVGADPHVYAKRYASGAWGTTTMLGSSLQGTSTEPQVAMDKNGNAFAIWVQSIPRGPDDFQGFSQVHVSQLASGTWKAPVQLAFRYEHDFVYTPKIKMNNNGQAIAAWDYRASLDLRAVCSRIYSSGTWGAETEVLVGYDMGHGSVGIDSKGNAMVVAPTIQDWDATDTVYDIYARRYTSGSWGEVMAIVSSIGAAASLAVDSTGNAMIAWSTPDASGTSSIYGLRFFPGRWASSLALEKSTYNALAPDVAMNAAGNAMIAWAQGDGTAMSIYARTYTKTYGAITLIETGSGQASSPQVAVDKNGNAIVVWQQKVGPISNIYANRYASGAWGTAKLLDALSGSAENPQIAIDGSGNAIAVWQQQVGAVYNIYASRYASGAWSTAKLIDTLAGTATDPQIAMDSAGNAFAVWQQVDDAAHSSIYAARYSAGAWAAPTVLETVTADCYRPQIAMDSSGRAVVVWDSPSVSSSMPGILANLYTSGHWGTAKVVTTTTESIWAGSVHLAMDSSGNALLTYAEHHDAYARFLTFASGTLNVGEAKMLDNIDVTEYTNVAMDDEGNAIVVSMDFGIGDSGVVWAQPYSSGTWGSARQLSTNTDTLIVRGVLAPQVAMNNSGNAIVVWGQKSAVADGFSIYGGVYSAHS